MELNDLFGKQGIDIKQVLVLRHRPYEPDLNRCFRWVAAERPDLFNAYQQTQSLRLERSMAKAGFVASFIGHEPGKALFIGLYSIGKSRPLTFAQYWKIPAHSELQALGMKGFIASEARSSILSFNLVLQDFYSTWKGKLVVGWPPPERTWWRRAHRNMMPILAVLQDSALDTDMPKSERLRLTWEELRVLPARWRAALCQWRGVYYIFDTAKQKGYVGSAYGENNLWHRWENYAATGHGGNRLLRKCDPKNFQFAILELVSPSMERDQVLAIEASWKNRLCTRSPYGLNDN